MSEIKDVPVFLFTGFLESGKTKFIQETLEDKRFNSGERTLLIVCEEGEEEYAPDQFSGKNVFIKVVEEPEELNRPNLRKWLEETNSERVVIEYNGMWMLDDLYQALPELGLKVEEECIVRENGRFFPLIRLVPGCQAPLSGAAAEIGPLNSARRDPVTLSYTKWLCGVLQRALMHKGGGENQQKAAARLQALTAYLEEE